MEHGPVFKLQIVDAHAGHVATFPGGGPLEANLIESCTAAILKRGVGVGKTQAQVATVTNPRNMLSQVASGAAMVGFSNAALTGSTALSHLATLFSYYWATAAGAIMAPALFDLGGLVVIPPGNQFAVGASAALTSATYDCSIIYEELPYLVTA